MKIKGKVLSSTAAGFLILFLILATFAAVDYGILSSRLKKLRTLEELDVRLDSTQLAVTKLGYALDIVVTSGHFTPTAAGFLMRDARTIDGEVKRIVTEPRYRGLLVNEDDLRDFQNFPRLWRRMFDHISALGKTVSEDDLARIHNEIDVVAIGINEEIEKILSTLTRNRNALLSETIYLIFLTLAVFILVLAASAIILYRLMIWPIRGLRDTAGALARRDASLRFTGPAIGPLAGLTQALNTAFDSHKERFMQMAGRARALEERIRRDEEKLKGLSGVLKFASSSLSLPGLLDQVVTTAVDSGGAGYAALYVYEGGELVMKASRGLDEVARREARVLPAGVHGETPDSDGLYFFDNIKDFPCRPYAGLLRSAGFSSLVAVRISSVDGLYGYMHAGYAGVATTGDAASSRALAGAVEMFLNYNTIFEVLRSEKKFCESALNQLPFGIALFDVEGRCRLANDTLRRLLGAGDDFDFIRDYTFREDEVLVMEGLTGAIEKSYEGFLTEFIVNYNPSLVRGFRFSGLARRLRIRSMPYYDPGGAISGVMLVYERMASEEPARLSERKAR